jgi:N-methylhydantoinase B
MMIVSDLGGMAAAGMAANATEIFHEGLVIPPVPYIQAGEPVLTVHSFIRSNSRVPTKVISDIDALAAGTAVVAARVGELLDRYGVPCVDEVVTRLIAYAEAMARRGLSDMPDGVFRGSYEVEGDGVETGRSFTVRCQVTIDGASCSIDFADTDPQARGPINSSWSQTLSSAVYAMRCYLDPYIPMNEGLYNAIDVTAPTGSLVNPNYPAACNLRIGVVHAMLDAIQQAMAGAFPERIGAPGSAAVVVSVSGAVTGQAGAWSMMETHFGVGGGRPGLDGVDGTPSPLYASAGWDRAIEAYELEYPVEYECVRLLPDSGGPGQWRGATGVMKSMRFTSDAWLTVRSGDRFDRAPPGMNGGGPGCAGSWIINLGAHDELRLPAKKTNHLVREGDRLTFINSGGGGFGDPWTRDPEAVARDVRHGIVTAERARLDYGVEIGGDGSGTRRTG